MRRLRPILALMAASTVAVPCAVPAQEWLQAPAAGATDGFPPDEDLVEAAPVPEAPDDGLAAQPLRDEAAALRPTIAPVSPVSVSARPVAPVSVAEGPVPAARPPPVDVEGPDRAAYEPLGVSLGGLRLDTTATAGVGTSSRSGAFWFSEGELRLATDRDRHALSLELRAGAERPFDGEGDPVVAGRVDGRYDITETDVLAGTLAYGFQREDADSLEGGGGRSDVHTLSATAGYQRRAGVVGLDVTAAADRTVYADDADRDGTLLSGGLRLTLDTGAAIRPFVEAGLFTRLPDAEVDAEGYRRRSFGGELRGGIAVDTGLVTGDVAVGYAVERFDDDRLGALRTVVGEGSLAFTPTELVTLGLRGSTTLEPSSIAGASGSVTHAVDATVAYALLPNVLLDAGAGLSFQDYTGIDRKVLTTRVGAGARWRANRSVELSLTVDHEIRDEGGPGAADSRETTVRAALTLRR